MTTVQHLGQDRRSGSRAPRTRAGCARPRPNWPRSSRSRSIASNRTMMARILLSRFGGKATRASGVVRVLSDEVSRGTGSGAALSLSAGSEQGFKVSRGEGRVAHCRASSATASGSSTTSRWGPTARSSSGGWRLSSATGACIVSHLAAGRLAHHSHAGGPWFDPRCAHFFGHCANLGRDEPVGRQDLGSAVNAQNARFDAVELADAKHWTFPPRGRWGVGG